MRKRPLFTLPYILIILFGGFLYSCDQQEKKLVVYAGKGLEKSMEEIKHNFENKYDIHIDMIYAGSKTLLTTINKTKIGDVFIPGSVSFIENAGDLVLDHHYVALHVPAFAVRKDNSHNINTINDLLQPGVKIAVGNKNMCAIGRIAEKILKASDKEKEFAENISITGSTVNELLDLVLHREVDASLVWSDMMSWHEAQDLKRIEIPQEINKSEKVHVAVLSTTKDKKNATLFADFVASEGKTYFRKNGFGE